MNDNYLPPGWVLFNSLIVIGCILATSIYAGLSEDMTTYDGASYSVAACTFFLWGYALFQFYGDIKHIK